MKSRHYPFSQLTTLPLLSVTNCIPPTPQRAVQHRCEVWDLPLDAFREAPEQGMIIVIIVRTVILVMMIIVMMNSNNSNNSNNDTSTTTTTTTTAATTTTTNHNNNNNTNDNANTNT